MLEDFKKPDLKAPRYRSTNLNLMNRDTFKRFVEKYPEYQGYDYDYFKKIVNTFNEELWNTAIEHRDGIELPENLGNVFIGTCWKPKRKNIACGKSQKYGKTLTHQNHETDGRLAKIFYTNYKNKYRFTNRVMWMFTGCRDFKRKVAEVYPNDWKKYIQVDPNSRINNLYRRRLMRDKMERRSERMMEYYNEFDMD
jgi:hypothetical protein